MKNFPRVIKMLLVVVSVSALGACAEKESSSDTNAAMNYCTGPNGVKKAEGRNGNISSSCSISDAGVRESATVTEGLLGGMRSEFEYDTNNDGQNEIAKDVWTDDNFGSNPEAVQAVRCTEKPANPIVKDGRTWGYEKGASCIVL